jgi:hypothetical protein
MLLILVFALAPLGARAQQASSATSGSPGTAATPSAAASAAIPYGSGSPSLPDLTGGGFSRSFFFFGADFSTRYDDNVRQSNADRIADVGYVVSPLVAFRREGSRLGLALRYRPTLLVYRRESAYNEQDQDFSLDASYRASARLRLRLRDHLLRRSGFLQSFAGPETVAPLGPPATLNETIVTPFVGEFQDDSRLDADWRLGPRTEAGVFVTYLLRTFGAPQAGSVPLLETEGKSAGARFDWRIAPDATLGLVNVYEDLYMGPRTQLSLEAPSAGLSVELSPTVAFDAFAGPVYARLRDTVLVPVTSLVTLALPIARGDWRWAAGGGIQVRRKRISLRLDGSSQVTDGGGLLDAVTSDAARMSLTRQLARRWRIEWAAGWQSNSTLAGEFASGRIAGEDGRVVIFHPISQTVEVGFGYEYERQRATGAVPLGVSFDRNFAYFTVNYRFKNLPLGR